MKTHDAGADTAQRQPAAQHEPAPAKAARGQAGSQCQGVQAAVDASPRVLAQRRAIDAAFGHAIQRQADRLEEEGLLQASIAPVAQRAAVEEEDDEAPLQGHFASSTVQSIDVSPVAAGSLAVPSGAATVSLNETGMPDQLKTGIESLSCMDLSDIRVHRNSDKPAQLNALAYAQGNEIHLGPGQEQHLPHEVWHVVQQRQGRVQATMQLAGVDVNDDAGLENEADVMGGLAANGVFQRVRESVGPRGPAGTRAYGLSQRVAADDAKVIQCLAGIEYETGIEARQPNHPAAAADYEGHVPQDTVMMTSGQGWNVVSDNSKLEFVTFPPVGTAALIPVFASMMNAVTGLRGHLGAVRSDFTTGFPGLPVGLNYTLMPYRAGPASGAMQGTVGVPIARLPDFFELLTTYGLGANEQLFTEHKRQLADLARRERTAVRAGAPNAAVLTASLQGARQAIKDEHQAGAAALSPEVIDTFKVITAAVNAAMPAKAVELAAEGAAAVNTLKGVLHFVGQYGQFAANSRTSYKKKAFPVLARSSFSSMYDALSAGCQGVFSALAADVLTRLGLDLGAQVFKGRTQAIGDSAKFTVQAWLDSIVAPVDRWLTDAQGNYTGAAARGDLMTAPGVNLHPTDNSMGTMGLDNGLVVVELRTIKHLVRAPFWTHDPQAALSFVADLARLEGA